MLYVFWHTTYEGLFADQSVLHRPSTFQILRYASKWKPSPLDDFQRLFPLSQEDGCKIVPLPFVTSKDSCIKIKSYCWGRHNQNPSVLWVSTVKSFQNIIRFIFDWFNGFQYVFFSLCLYYIKDSISVTQLSPKLWFLFSPSSIFYWLPCLFSYTQFQWLPGTLSIKTFSFSLPYLSV